MICNREDIELLADRIERAYNRRNPRWLRIGMAPGVWLSAASRLLEISHQSPAVPIDPELFVAVLSGGKIAPDPWAELTQRRSQTRYLQALRRIIGQLRGELKRELRHARRLLLRGASLDEVLAVGYHRISPLACYILAYHADRFDLSFRHRDAATGQHQSCPLYRQACLSLLPDHAYPGTGLSANPFAKGQDSAQFSRN